MMILAGDIGGTKTILALYKIECASLECIKKDVFASADFNSFDDLLECFLEDVNLNQLVGVCIGVAGPIVNGNCITTNLPWLLKQKDIAQKTGIKNVTLLNDLEATAWGVLGLSEDKFVELNSVAKECIGNKAVLAAGTGLGEALLIWSDEKYHVVATEGGHTDFAPRNQLEIGLLQYLMEIHRDHVSYERVVCGQGLINIYEYLKLIDYATVGSEVESMIVRGGADPAAVISEQAEKNSDKLCLKAQDMFCEIYGAEAGNLALKSLPRAGIVLAGGIAAKILPSMQKGEFMRGFLSKGRYKSALQEISVKVCLDPEVGLQGAAAVAWNQEQ